MDKRNRFTLKFIAGCTAVALAACIAISMGLISLIRWYLGNCGATPSCVATDIVISYWWALFIPVCLLAAWLFRRMYDKQYARRFGDG